MDETTSFGSWVKRRRTALRLTQNELARGVAVSVAMIRRVEADERRPSNEVAARLAQVLAVLPEEQATFRKVARAELAADRLPTYSAVGPSSFPVPSQDTLLRPHHAALPVPLTPLIGRAQEVAAALLLLQRPAVRLLTLTPDPYGGGWQR